MAIKDISQLKREIEKIFEDLLTKDLMVTYAEEIRDTIYKRTKSGKGLTSDSGTLGRAGLTQLKALSDSYIAQRQGKVKFFVKNGTLRVVPRSRNFRIDKPKFGKHGSPKRSNLTFTGQMLEALKITKSGSNVFVEIVDSKRKNSKLSNNEVAAIVSEERPFFGLAASELKRIENFIRRSLRQKLRSRR